MGRWSKGVSFTVSSMKLDINYLRKNGYIQENCTIQGTLGYTNGNKMAFKSIFSPSERFIELSYTLTTYEGKKTVCNYKVDIVQIPSNLGKGYNWYLICPVSGRKAKILYSAYGSPKFMCREEYARRRCRVYYPVQTSSKYEYHNDRYWELERSTIPRLRVKRGKKTYRGKPTKRYLRLQKAWEQWEYFERIRWSPQNLPKSCLKDLWQVGR